MVRAVYATLLVLSVSTHVTPQFFDFFGLQPIGPHTIRPFFQFDITTKRTRTHKTTRRPETTTKWNTPFSLYSDEFNRRTTKRPETTTKRSTTFSFYSEDLEREKQKNKNAPAVYDYYSTTTKPSRKTTKSNPIRRHYDPNSRDSVSLNSNVNKVVSKETTNSNSGRNSQNNNSNTRNNKAKMISDTRNVNVQNIPKQQQSVYNTNDRLVFDDDGRRNTVINYETTKSIYTTKPIYTTKSPYIYQTTRKNLRTTSRPYTIRPGVKPAVVNGPPITNRPPTRRPSFGPQGVNDDVTPELIIGPNEDYMSTVEKKRYIELAERMCDKYKALDIKQIQAIPLVPSPDPVRVNVSTCTPIEAALVVGGRVASIQEFRHMVLLGWHKTQSGGYSWKCGGSLVSDRYVLTAAHCAYQDRDNSVAIGPPQMVQLGSSYLDDPGALVVRVAAVIRHPKYKLPKSYYDIALVKMARSVTFSSVIKPACLGIPPPPGKPIIATGWGRTEFGGDQSEELRSVSLPIWDMAECYNVLGTSRRLPEGPSSDSQICAGEKKGGKDTCQGDSGGPAQIQDGCSWRVVAVTSVGRSCGAAHTPALYAKVPRAFVSAVVFGEQSDSNNQYSNNNQQSNTNNQQSNNNNQQWNNQQSNNQSPQWNTNQQQPNLWDGQQQSNNQQQNNNNQQWNNNQQPTNQWNSQQQPNNQQSNWNNNQQDNSWTWNRYQKEQNKNPLNNQQQSNNNQGTYNNQEQSKNNRNNQNVKRNDQNNYNNQHGQSNVYQSSNQNPNGYENSNNQNKRNNDQYNRGQSNNDYVTEKPVDNNQYGGYGYTTEEPIYNQYNGYNNGYTTQEPVYNQDSGYNNGYTTEKPVYNQHNGHNNGYTTEKPVYNQNSGYNTGYTTEKPVYNQPSYNNGYYSGDYGAVVPSGYQPHRVYNNDDRVWWT